MVVDPRRVFKVWQDCHRRASGFPRHERLTPHRWFRYARSRRWSPTSDRLLARGIAARLPRGISLTHAYHCLSDDRRRASQCRQGRCFRVLSFRVSFGGEKADLRIINDVSPIASKDDGFVAVVRRRVPDLIAERVLRIGADQAISTVGQEFARSRSASIAICRWRPGRVRCNTKLLRGIARLH